MKALIVLLLALLSCACGGEDPMLSMRSGPGLSPLVLACFGQSNALGDATYDDVSFGPWNGDNRVAFYEQGIIKPFKPTANLIATPTHGIELYLAPQLATDTSRKIVYGRAAVNATSIDTWIPSGGTHWQKIVDSCAAIKRTAENQAHVLWIQGETDAGNASYPQATYETNLAAIFSGVRTQLSPMTVRFHVLLVNANLFSVPSLANIRAAMTNVVNADGNADLVNVDDISPAISSIHYDSDQWFLTVGPRFRTNILAHL
jgi:hypothetical protein